MGDGDLSRRDVLAGLFSVGGAMMMNPTLAAQGSEERAAVEGVRAPEALSSADVLLNINGQQHRVARLGVNTTLLDCLRDDLHMTGTKKGCGLGQCGACTVLVDGRRMTSCLTLAVMQQGKDITTIEGLSEGDTLHPVQAAFIEHDGFQCGYCTPGQIMSAVACIDEGHTRSEAEIREWMSGNLCRCGAYPNIVAAVRQAAQRGA